MIETNVQIKPHPWGDYHYTRRFLLAADMADIKIWRNHLTSPFENVRATIIKQLLRTID